MTTNDDELDIYADGAVTSKDAKVPHWLKWIYILCPIWGVIWLVLFWNGSTDNWFDRGHWGALQKAASTVYPYNEPDRPTPSQENGRESQG
ncbi:MAG: hypothetical protein H7A37_04050 [Chlamydiales bacterium]|nr:hypothetical protein [Chlamydiia bacterium]MCP5507458.1 hypothetical protein [Chlamydiales bacterium]